MCAILVQLVGIVTSRFMAHIVTQTQMVTVRLKLLHSLNFQTPFLVSMEARNGRGSSSRQFVCTWNLNLIQNNRTCLSKIRATSYLEYRIAGNIKFDGGVSGPFIKKRCRLSIQALEQGHEFANLQEIKLAVC